MDLTNARSDGSRPRLAAVGLAALPIVGLVVFVLALALGTRSAHVPVLAVALVQLLLTLVPLLLDQGRPPERRHVLLTIISIAWGVVFVLPIFTRYFPEGGYDPSEEWSLLGVHPTNLVKSQLVILAGYVSMLVGYSAPFAGFVVQALPKAKRDWSLAGGLAVALIMIPLGWSLYLGGQFGLVPRRAGSGVLGMLASSTTSGFALLTAIYLRHRSRLAYLMLLAAIPPTMAFNFFTGSKGLFFAPLAMIAVTYIVVRRRLRIRWAVLAVAAFSLFYPVAQFYREVVQEGNTKTAIQVLQDPAKALRQISLFTSSSMFGEYFFRGLTMTSTRFSGLDTTSVIIRDTPSRVPYQYGWTIGYIFMSYVPRVIWPSKPDTTIGQWVTDHYSGGPGIRSQTGPSWIGELYLNFGLLGVVAGMFLLGTYFRVLHGTVYQSGAPIPCVWASVMFVYQIAPAIGTGALIGPINVLPYFGGLVLTVHVITRYLGGTIPIGAATRSVPAGALPAPAGS